MKQFEQYNSQLAEMGTRMPRSTSVDQMQRQDEIRAAEQARLRAQEILRRKEQERLARLQTTQDTKRALLQQMEEKRKSQQLTIDFERKYAESIQKRLERISEIQRAEQTRLLESRRNYQKDLLSQMEENRRSKAALNSLSPAELLMNLAEVEAIKKGVPVLRQRAVPGLVSDPPFFTPPRVRLPGVEKAKWRQARRSAATPSPSTLFS